MSSPIDWFPLFMIGMAVGCLLNLPFAPIRDTGYMFHVFVAAMSLCFLVIGYFLVQPFTPPGRFGGCMHDYQILMAIPGIVGFADLLLAAGLLALLLALSFELRFISIVCLSLICLAGIFALCFSGMLIYSQQNMNARDNATVALACLTIPLSAFLVGCTLVGMLVGHSYLRNRSMPFSTLQRMARVYAWALGARFALYLVAFFLVYVPLWKASPLSFEMLLEQHLPFQLLRVLAGFILSAPLAYMILKCADLRSNQSATGILYVAVVFALIGELVGFYYFGQTGVPL